MTGEQLPLDQKRLSNMRITLAKPYRRFQTGRAKQRCIKNVVQRQSVYTINRGSFHFELVPLVPEAQFSPISAAEILDYDLDGKPDIILCGNFLDVLPEIGQYDANYGLVLRGKGDFIFDAVPPKTSGFFVTGQVRKMRSVKDAQGRLRIFLARNNDSAIVYSVLAPLLP